MTFPSSLTKTFDTSLVDINRSFSSTETDTSTSSSVKENQLPSATVPPVKVSQLTTHHTTASASHRQEASAFDQAREVYGTIDDDRMHALIPDLVSTLQQSRGEPTGQDQPIAILGLGCSTERNMLELFNQCWTRPLMIVSCDPSTTKLEALRRQCENQIRADHVQMRFDTVDFSRPGSIPDEYSGVFDTVISSLVYDHIPLRTIFVTIAKALRPYGCAVVTGMHPDVSSRLRMGEGFTVIEAVETANEAGLELIGELEEITLTSEMVEGGLGLVGELGREWIGMKVWFGVRLRKT